MKFVENPTPFIENFFKEARARHGNFISTIISKYIKTANKIEKCKLDIRFNQTCLDNDKLPNYTRINLPNDQLSKSDIIPKFRRNLLKKEIRNKTTSKRNLEKELQKLTNQLFDLSPEEWLCIINITNLRINKLTKQTNKSHERKLKKLNIKINTNIQVDPKNINKSRNRIGEVESVNNNETVFNLSKRMLNDVEKEVLNKGLKYGIKSKRVDTYEILSRFEQLAQSLNNLTIYEDTDSRKAQLDSKNVFLSNLQSMAFEFIELSKEATDHLTDEERKALEELAKDKTIIITKADKGNAVVIQDVEDYRKKISEILEKDGKFKQLLSDETQKREKRLQNYLRTLKKDKKISEETYKKITPCGSRAGVLYGLPKIHKDNAPLRPIISAVKTYNYQLAKFLAEKLKPILEGEFMLKDTFDFVNKVSKIEPGEDQTMASFDVESLFTNVPTLETIELILDAVYKDNGKFEGLEKEDLRTLLTICVQQSHFQFNGKFYDQIDGVSMGSPLGPLFANVFMSYLEKKYMRRLQELGVLKWYRYVDDVFAVLNNNTNGPDILRFLNGLHPNIKFTVEHEENKRIAFLDTTVVRKTSGYHTTLYRKKTFTGVYLNWTSLTSRKYKLSLIYCLLDRIWKICSLEDDRKLEIRKLKEILKRNEYPEEIIEHEINKFLKNRSEPTNEHDNVENTMTTVQRAKKYITLPYSGEEAEDFAIRLKKLVERNFPQVDMKVAFKTPNEVGKLFPFKDRVKEPFKQSLVVYKITCQTCKADYIGKTERILQHRINEHKKSTKSALMQHIKENPRHKIDYENIEILDRAESDFKLRLKEMLHINKRKPILNTQLNCQFNSQVNTLIIAKH